MTETPERRSRIMRAVKGVDTAAEITVRRMVHQMGYRFRLHRKDLPGAPDLVFPRLRRVVFVHGCFWHQHAGCRRAHVPKSRQEYWAVKLARNVARDHGTAAALRNLGWQVAVIWECETTRDDLLVKRLGS